jgi:superfamily I DNA/RNA helicase
MQACYFNTVPKYPNKELVNITNKESLQELMKINSDIKQLSSLQLTLCNTYGNLTEAKKKFASLCASADEAEVSISTIHRSKGLEWDSVVIDDDFISFKDDDECESNPIADMWDDVEKTNLLYVAITRAKVICELPNYLQSYFN